MGCNESSQPAQSIEVADIYVVTDIQAAEDTDAAEPQRTDLQDIEEPVAADKVPSSPRSAAESLKKPKLKRMVSFGSSDATASTVYSESEGYTSDGQSLASSREGRMEGQGIVSTRKVGQTAKDRREQQKKLRGKHLTRRRAPIESAGMWLTDQYLQALGRKSHGWRPSDASIPSV